MVESVSASPPSPLGLGTVQFGLAYGVMNQGGQVSLATARDILDAAHRSGVVVLDTAPAYGGSEAVLGELEAAKRFGIVTKTAKISASARAVEAVDAVVGGFAHSLGALRADKVDALLVHDPADLLGPFGDRIWSAMARLRSEGSAIKIGVSVYTGDEINRVLDRYDPDLIQLPFNALDNRLRDGGQLDRLAAAGVEVHARSIFLQGLLLQNPGNLPAKFQRLAPAIAGMSHAFAQTGLSMMEGLIGSVLTQPGIGKIIVGTTSPDEFCQVERATRSAVFHCRCPDIRRWQISDERLLNPALWSTL